MSDTFHTFLSVTGRGNIAIPAQLRRQYHLDEPGAQVELTVRDDGVWEMRPHVAIPADEAWYWTPEFQAGEREVEAQIARGEFQVFDGPDEFIAHLDQLSQEAETGSRP